MKTGFLKKVSGTGKGRIFNYTPELAKRSDMVPCDKDGNAYGSYVSTSGGLAIEGPPSADVKSELREKDQMIQGLQAQIEGLMQDNQENLAKIAEQSDYIKGLEAKLSGEPVEEPAKPEPPRDMDDAERMNLIVSITMSMIEENDLNNFTGQGKPRVEVLEAKCGIADVTGAERDEAFEKAQALMG